MNQFSWTLGAFFALISLATVAVLVSQNAQTAKILQTIATGVAQDIGAATKPVAGASAAFGGAGLQ